MMDKYLEINDIISILENQIANFERMIESTDVDEECIISGNSLIDNYRKQVNDRNFIIMKLELDKHDFNDIREVIRLLDFELKRIEVEFKQTLRMDNDASYIEYRSRVVSNTINKLEDMYVDIEYNGFRRR